MQFFNNGPSSIPRSVVNEDRMASGTDHLRIDQAVEQFADSFCCYGKDLFLIITGDHDTQRWWQEIIHLEDAPWQKDYPEVKASTV